MYKSNRKTLSMSLKKPTGYGSLSNLIEID